MKSAWLVKCENEYTKTVEFVCATETLANELRDLLQAAADDGDGEGPLSGWFYGRFSVEERKVVTTMKNARTGWYLADHAKRSIVKMLLPDAWKERLSFLFYR